MPARSRSKSREGKKGKSKSPGRPKKSPSKSPARKRSVSKSPGRKPKTPKSAQATKTPKTAKPASPRSEGTTKKTPATTERSRSRGRPRKSETETFVRKIVTSVKKTPTPSRSRSTSASRREPATATVATPAVLRLARTQPLSSVSRIPTRSNAQQSKNVIVSSLSSACTGCWNLVTAPYYSLKRKSRRNQFTRKDVLCIIFVLLIAFAIYWTWNYKHRYYRDAYAYVQGYTEAIKAYARK